MATKYECDRCGEIGFLRLKQVDIIYSDSTYYPKKDLCDNCIYQLQDWLKPLSQEVKK